MPDGDDIEADNARLRHRAELAEAQLRMRHDPNALPAGEALFRLTRTEKLVAVALIGAALASRLGL